MLTFPHPAPPTHGGAVSSPVMITSESLDASSSVASRDDTSLCSLCVGEWSFVESDPTGDLTPDSLSPSALPTHGQVHLVKYNSMFLKCLQLSLDTATGSSRCQTGGGSFDVRIMKQFIKYNPKYATSGDITLRQRALKENSSLNQICC